ncbi:MAG: HEAT repeat domain-containing protein [Chloroflexi bacterium]|nr:HEAT repeat domain-containing protein [Chloroflexota bacterium]
MRFDLVSFLLGFLTATIFFGLIYRFREGLRNTRDNIGDTFKRFGERLSSGAEQRYRQDVLGLWQTHHIAGSIIALDEIFVQPHFWIDEPMADPGKEPESDLTLVVPSTPDFPDLTALYQTPSYTLRDLARAPHSLIVVGRPGAGKSALLAQLGSIAAESNVATEIFDKPVVPALVHVGDLELPIAEKTDPAQPLVEAVSARLSAITAPAFPSFFKNILKEGKALILLDGFDDLPSSHQALVIEWLRNFRATYGKNRIIATGPLAGFAPFLSLDFVPVIMGGWSTTMFQSLVDKWVAVWPSVLAAQKRRKRDDDLDPALVAGWLTGGAGGRSPLDVSLKIWTGLAGDAEGARPVDWFETFVKRLSIAPEARKALERAAAEMLSRDRYGAPREKLVEWINASRAETAHPSSMDADDLVDELARKGGLLVKRSGGRYSFSHPAVAGYLAARHFAAGSDTDAITAVHGQPGWTVALRFYASLANASSIAMQRVAAPPDAFQTDLFAAAGWLSDAPLNAPWRGDVFRKLAQFFVTQNLPTQLRARAACALVASRDESVNKLFKQNLSSADPLARQYAVLALGALSDMTAVGEIRKLLNDDDLYVRWAAALALAVIGDQNSLEGLAVALVEGNEQLRRAVCEALALHPAEGHKMLQDAIKDKDVVVRRGAVAGMKRVGPAPWVLELLDNAFLNDTQWLVRNAAEAAAQELREPPDHFPEPVPSPETSSWLVAFAASKGRGVPAGPASKAALVQAMQDGDEPNRMAAADYLGRLTHTDAIPVLIAAARENSPGVRDAAYKALAHVAMATGQRIAL